MMMIDSDSPNKTNQVQKRRHPLRWVAALLILLAVGWCFLQWQLWGIQVTVTQVGVHGLPDGFEGLRIVQISDLHGHEYGQDSEALLALVAQQVPEFIVVTGDLIDQESHLAMVPALARGLAAIAPTYYVTGNHEWAVGGVPRLKGILTECGVTVLSNQYVTLERNGDSLVLAGVDDPNGYAGQKSPEEVAGEVKEAAGDGFWLLMAHRNNLFDGEYCRLGADLVLSGHGHGGIWRLPFTDGLLGAGGQLLPGFTNGFYRCTDGHEAQVFVTRGLGGIPRLFNHPQVAVLTLHCE